jgi:hypothetical protein
MYVLGGLQTWQLVVSDIIRFIIRDHSDLHSNAQDIYQSKKGYLWAIEDLVRRLSVQVSAA